MQQPTESTTHNQEKITASLREEYALLSRLKELRRQGRQEQARELARYLELRDQADDWSMRYGA